MPSYHVERSTVIAAECAAVFEKIADFRQWPAWSPWLILEPGCTLSFEGEQGTPGATYGWDGERVGAGSMRLERADDRRLEMTLTFVRPFKSRATVAFDLLPDVGGCKVTWHMWGSLPWFLFFLTKKMQAWIGMDYERGLLMLKSLVETGAVPSRVEVAGFETLDAQPYVGIRRETNLAQIGPAMHEDFDKLHGVMASEGLRFAGAPFALYEKMDMITKELAYTLCFPVEACKTVPAPFVCDTLEGAKTWKVVHTGAYEFLGNAWSLAMTASRREKIRTKKVPMGLERYLDDPCDVAPEALKTEIVLFVR